MDTLAFVDTIGRYFAPITDTFTRTVADGWGSADTGEAWTTSGGAASDYSVTGTVGRHSLGSVNVARSTAIGTGLGDVDIRFTFAVAVLAAGAPIGCFVRARWVDANNYYEFEVDLNTNQSIGLFINRRVAGSGSNLGSVTHPTETHQTTDTFAVRFQLSGPFLRCKFWNNASSEPAAWTLEAFDHALTSGAVHLVSLLGAGNTSALPVLVDVDAFTCGSATVMRLDLNDDVTWSAPYDGFDFSPPRLRRAAASTLLADGAVIPAAAYDNRVLRMRLELKTSTVDGSATEIQKLVRELDRASNVLMWQPGTSEPVFFRTMRSDLTSITEMPGSGTLRVFDVEVLAEPFAYGLRESLASQVVINDPAATPNGMFFDVTAPKGDVETPLFLSAPGFIGIVRRTLLAVRRRGTPSGMPLFVQVEAFTMETDTSTPNNDSEMSGTGNNYTQTTFATVATMTGRASIAAGWGVAPSVDVRGGYRVFARCNKTVAGDVIKMRLKLITGTITVTNDTATITANASTNRNWRDLGYVQFPVGVDPVVDGYSGVPIAAQTPMLRIDAERTSGTGNLRMDVLMFVPADDRLCVVRWAASSSVVAHVLDSARALAYAIGSSAGGFVASDDIPTIQGGTPMIAPGVTNRIVFVRSIGEVESDSITATVTVTPWYWPRYLYARPATT